MKGNRPKKRANEALPVVEVRRHEHNIEVRFNFAKVAAAEEQPASFSYDYVKVRSLTKKTVKVAIIRSRYDENDELAMLHNKISTATEDQENYQNYINFRDMADQAAIKAVLHGTVQ